MLFLMKGVSRQSTMEADLDAIVNRVLQLDYGQLEFGSVFLDDLGFHACHSKLELRLIEKRLWESHDRIIDLHICLEGVETIAVSYAGSLTEDRPYDEAGDAHVGQCPEGLAFVTLSPGDALALMPGEAHAVGLGDSGTAHKIVVKVPLSVIL